MGLILYYFWTNVIRQLSYRINFFGNLVLTIVFYSLQFVFIDTLLDFDSSLGGNGKEAVYLIFIVFSILFLLVGIISSSIDKFFDIVYNGGIDPFLTKPISPTKLIFFGWSSPFNFLILLLISPIILSSIEFRNLPNDPIKWIAFIVSLICVIICNISMIFGLNLITLLVQRKIPVDYIHERIFDLSIVPLNIFNINVIRWLVLILPVAISSSLPVSILFGHSFWMLPSLIFSTILILSIVIIAYSRIFKSYNGIGG